MIRVHSWHFTLDFQLPPQWKLRDKSLNGAIRRVQTEALALHKYSNYVAAVLVLQESETNCSATTTCSRWLSRPGELGRSAAFCQKGHEEVGARCVGNSTACFGGSYSGDSDLGLRVKV